VSLPRATMRLQLHRGFRFADAAPLAPYFAALGISHVYASPIMTARRGSMHGYDVVDPTRINPELGGEDAFRRFVAELRRHELGLIVDIVPNHMATGSENAWWMEALRHGRSSAYAHYFDIDWEPPNRDLAGKILLPILGRPYGEALEAGEITLGRDTERSKFVIRYFDHLFPLAPGQTLDEAALRDFDAGSAHGRERLHALLERQHYRLAWWRTANDEINWRRFFDINELVALRVEDEDVFDAVHAKAFQLYGEGLIDGVRVDHIDGLTDPEKYCRALRQRLYTLESKRPPDAPKGEAYIVVEKILARDEALPAQWRTDGTTGYDFMNEVSAVLHDERGGPVLRDLWQRVSGRPGDFETEEELARRQILERSFFAQREALVETLSTFAQSRLATRDYSRAAIRRCLTEILVSFRVYRIYARVDRKTSPADQTFLSRAIARATETCLPGDRQLVLALGNWLGGKSIHPSLDQLQNVALARFEQLSAPLCAKAVEDTAFYRYGVLLSRNDVGFDPRAFACSADEFHRRMGERLAAFPHAMLATATHDHKRGEDVRARLAVLSEIPQDWAEAVERWIALSQASRAAAADDLMPSGGDLAMLFQIIVGAWPHGLEITDQAGLAAFADRIAAWQRKALREAKVHSDWSAPDETYERAAADTIAWLFGGGSALLAELAAFARRIAAAGAANGLAQMLVKLTAPGVPDIYQGREYWDLSLVDPDNRSAVDFAARQRSSGTAPLDELVTTWQDGRLKQFVMARILALRKKMPGLFSAGQYVPLMTSGLEAERVVAFARTSPDAAVIVAFYRFNIRHAESDSSGLHVLQCSETRVAIPRELNGTFSDVLRPERTVSVTSPIAAQQLLGHMPIVALASEPNTRQRMP
jgi:(1->4)-alpha-D-glucan 1-alpha-D-glucosylmutase